MALYNNGFPATYPQMYQTYTPVQVQPQNVAQVQQPMQGSPIWVQGESGAKSYLVSPNTTVQLWDSESQTIYLKSADASGMPTMKVLDYTIRQDGVNAPKTASALADNNSINYATKDEIEGVEREIDALKCKVEKLMRRKTDDE